MRISSPGQKDKIRNMERAVMSSPGWVDITAYLDNDIDHSGRNMMGLMSLQKDKKLEVKVQSGRTYARSLIKKPKRPIDGPKPLRISGNTDPRDYMENFYMKKTKNVKTLEEAYNSVYFQKPLNEGFDDGFVFRHDSTIDGIPGTEIINTYIEAEGVIDPDIYYFLEYEGSEAGFDDSDYNRETGYGKHITPVGDRSEETFTAAKQSFNDTVEITESDPEYDILFMYAKEAAEKVN